MSYFSIILNDIIRVSKGLFILSLYGIYKLYQYLGTFVFLFLLLAYFTYKSRNPYDYTTNYENLITMCYFIPALLIWFINPLIMYRKSLNDRYMEE